MKIPCPSCSQNLEIPEEMAGQTIDCPVCNGSFTVPPSEPASTQPKLKLTKAPKPPGLSKKQISQQQSTQGANADDVLRNLSNDITAGSPTATNVARSLTGSNTALRETRASKTSGSLTAMIVGVFAVGAFLLNFGFGDGLFKGGVVKTHERVVSIESKMVNTMNSSQTPQDQSKAVAEAVAKLKKIKVDHLDEGYKEAFQDYIQALQKWSLALKKGDLEKADEFDDLRIDETRRLNEIYNKQPEVVTPLRF
tara:strand:- start:883 stop:1638 length:756 start_codon:yes stop_codon:yes gene_type:complete